MAWRVELTSQAAHTYERLALPERRRVDRALEVLEHEPRPAGKRVRAIKGSKDEFLRYRVGDLRILYEVFDDACAIVVHGIVPRKDLETWLRRHR